LYIHVYQDTSVDKGNCLSLIYLFLQNVFKGL